MTRTARLALGAGGLGLALALTGCSTLGDVPPPRVEVAEELVTEAPAAEPVATEVPAPTAPVADEFSQVIDGTLYQGTEIAPVRIGTDTPGQPPAAEAGFVAAEGLKEYATQQDKYVVAVFEADEGWLAKIHGMSRHGTFREVGDNGYRQGIYYPTRDAAVAAGFPVDGRLLDRAEYILVLN